MTYSEVTKLVCNTKVTPEDYYENLIKILGDLEDHEVIAFRPPKKGDLYLASPNGKVIYSAHDDNPEEPRLIVKKLEYKYYKTPAEAFAEIPENTVSSDFEIKAWEPVYRNGFGDLIYFHRGYRVSLEKFLNSKIRKKL